MMTSFRNGTKLISFLMCVVMTCFSQMSSSQITNENWDFANSQRWIGEALEGSAEYCEKKSTRWDVPTLDFDINNDSIDDFLFVISCYQ